MAYDFEPETAAFVGAVEQSPPTEGLSLDQLRDGYRATVIANSVVIDAQVDSEDRTIAVGDRSLPIRLYRPGSAPSRGPLLIYVHGGGFAVGDLESHDRLIRLIVAESGIRALAIDYRRAPEAPYPAALDDVIAAYGWAQAHAEDLQIDPARIALGGESAGATHATMASIATSEAAVPPALLWAFVPALDPLGRGESHRSFATGAGRTATEFAYLWSLYLPDASQREDPSIAPSHADATRLPRTLFYTAEFDPARDDGEDFAARATSAGADVTVKRKAGLVHQFPEITGISPRSRQAVVDAAHELAAALQAS